MAQIDMQIYSATNGLPGGPTIIPSEPTSISTIEPYRDDEGNVTKGGWIGYFTAYAIMLAGALYCMFFL